MSEKREIMKWKAERPVNDLWYTLEMEDHVEFREFMDDILNRKDNYGRIEIQLTGKFLTLTYDRGIVTWISDETLNRIGDCIVTSGRAHGFPTHVDYHIMVREGN